MNRKAQDRVTRHDENLARLARAEGQIRGIRRMIREGKYCVDIMTQLQAVRAALAATGRRILRKHLEHCVAETMRGGAKAAADTKINELMALLEREFRR